jgi:hypothetical protein
MRKAYWQYRNNRVLGFIMLLLILGLILRYIFKINIP